jgi:subtilisin-like proprotein convertase family protein
LALLAVAAHALVAAPAVAAVPATTMIEGSLSSVGGGPVVDGFYDVTFALYKDELGGNPLYTEGPVTISVKNGMWTWQLGSKAQLQQAALANAPALWFAIKVGTDAELARRPVTSVVFALRAALAEGLDCSGCIGATQLDPKALADYAKTASLAKVATSGKFEDLSGGPDLAGYAKSADLNAYAKSAGLAKVASSGDYADLKGTPDLAGYAKTANLAKVAGSGAYADLIGTPDLNVFAKLAALAKVATSGSYNDLADLPALATVATSGDYADLKGAPVVPVVGKTCGTGLVIRGFKDDGSYDCVSGGGKPLPADLPPDGIDEISNGLILNQFTDSVAGTANAAIKDNNPTGTSDTIDFPDIGVAQKLTVSVDLVNSNLEGVKVTVFDPNSVAYVLCGGASNPPCGKKGDGLKTSFPDPSKPASGDLTTWVGNNPKGKWYLSVIDTDFCTAPSGCVPNTTDGKVNAWSINLQTLSNKKIQVKGDLIVDGKLLGSVQTAGLVSSGGGVQLAEANAVCDAAHKGALRYGNSGLEVCDASTKLDNSKVWTWFAARPKPIVWSGGCTNHGTGGGWNAYCTNGVDNNTAADYLDVNPNGTITVKKSGWYRINYFGIANQCNWAHVRIAKTGYSYIHHGHNHSFNTWQDNFADVLWPFKEGEWMRVDVYNTGCNNYAYHAWNNGPDYSGAHSRLQVEFVGAL